ncbi:Stk1 family PASTA domain-containing Ser/Thr kinase [Alicyclobacillaceae bacterium I2511]|nr:Stk1 family PASTA domain-containing Ser/Thr kinase [Alicyclobacillaceae bacterium I2511]
MTKLLGGRYDLQTEIGGGGMAVVYRALDTALGRQVAVKMLRTEFADDEEFVSLFRREAQSAASLSHPNIVNLYDVGITSENEYYIVMEYVDGPTLKEVIRQQGRLPVKQTLDIVRQISAALEHAHDHNIIHRDIKPHNILLTRTGQVKVTDFGIARAVSGATITHHQSHSVLGSVHYFSPEQARGATVDAKSDIYSLGVVMYEMLTGQLPFSGETPVSVALKHLREPFIEPKVLVPEIPQSVENIILCCMVKSPEHRYPDMGALQTDLDKALIYPDVPKFISPDQNLERTLPVPVMGNFDYAGTHSAPSAKVEKTLKESKPPRKRWWTKLLWSMVALAIVVAGAAAAYYIFMALFRVPNLYLPNVTGKPVQQAVHILAQDGFSTTQITEKQANNNAKAGVVYEQDPPGPTQVKKTRPITLWVSKGPQDLSMPDLSGVPLTEAQQNLENMGIAADHIKIQQVQSTQVGAGQVVSSTPLAGQPVSGSDTVTLQVSQGATVTVPNVIGMTLADAEKALLAAHLQPGQVTRMPYAGVDQTVFQTTPYQSGDTVPAGTAIGLYVVDNSTQPSTGNAVGGNNTGGPPSNSTSTGNATSGGTPPAGAVSKQVLVKVNDASSQSIQVQILKSDAVNNNAVVVDQVITGTTSWTITVYVTADVSGVVTVYENGKLVNRYPVSAQTQ